jgi:hypothetical protein
MQADHYDALETRDPTERKRAQSALLSEPIAPAMSADSSHDLHAHMIFGRRSKPPVSR